MAKTVEQVLAEYQQSDLTVKLCSTMFSVMPFAPPFALYANLEQAAARVSPGAGPELIAKARALAATEEIGKALWVAGALDTSDQLIAGMAGVKNIFSLFSDGPKKSTFEADSEQATDAAVKAIGLAYIIHKLFPGEVGQKVAMFRELPAGQEAALYYVSAEVALPFADNLAEAGAGLIGKLMARYQSATVAKFSSFAGADSVAQATGVMGQLGGVLEEYVGKAKNYANPLTQKLKGILPSAMNFADSVSGAAASGVDLLPVWTFLGARLAAEACVLRAARGL